MSIINQHVQSNQAASVHLCMTLIGNTLIPPGISLSHFSSSAFKKLFKENYLMMEKLEIQYQMIRNRY